MLVVSLVLAACQSIDTNESGFVLPPDLGLNRLMAVPKPFETKKDLPLIQTAAGENDLTLAPIAGLSGAEHSLVAEAVARAADSYDFLVMTSQQARRTHVLEGIATKTPDALTIQWFLSNAYGEPVRKFTVSAALSAAEPRLSVSGAQRIGNDTAQMLQRALGPKFGGASRATPGEEAMRDESLRLFAGAVQGAPGNGDTMLPIAIKAMLEQDNLVLADSAVAASYVISGEVRQEPAEDRQVVMTLIWRLSDPAGLPAGEISQTNMIPSGALDGDWGATAYDVARGAVDGLHQMLAEIEAKKTGAGAGDAPEAAPVLIPDSVFRKRAR